MIAFAGDFYGVVVGYEVYSNGVFMESGEWPLAGGVNFRGFVSEKPFDQVRLTGHTSFLTVDDLHFAAIPAPAVWAMLVAGGLSGVRRRTR